MLNRAAVVIRPKQPFLDWIIALDDPEFDPDDEGEGSVYLMPSFETDEDAWAILEDRYEDIFDNELFAWEPDSSEWPEDRNFDLFRAWFDVEFHSVVEDLCDYAIEDEENAYDEDIEEEDENEDDGGDRKN